MSSNVFQKQSGASPQPECSPKGTNSDSGIFWERLELSLPPVFARTKVDRYCGGLIAAGTLANLDSQGKGPAVRVRVGKQVGYERASFVEWLKGRAQSEPCGNSSAKPSLSLPKRGKGTAAVASTMPSSADAVDSGMRVTGNCV